MNEPDNLTLAMIGRLPDDAPWNVEIWVRHDDCAPGSTARWYQCGIGDNAPSFRRLSWSALQEHARERDSVLTVIGLGAA